LTTIRRASEAQRGGGLLALLLGLLKDKTAQWLRLLIQHDPIPP
jgi:hypothetical protein